MASSYTFELSKTPYWIVIWSPTYYEKKTDGKGRGANTILQKIGKIFLGAVWKFIIYSTIPLLGGKKPWFELSIKIILFEKRWSKFSTNMLLCRWLMMIPSTRDPPLPTCFTVTARIYRNCNSRNLFARAWENTPDGRKKKLTSYLFFSFAGCSGITRALGQFLWFYLSVSDTAAPQRQNRLWVRMLISTTIDNQPQQLRMAVGMQDPKQLSKCQPYFYHFCC